MLFDCPKHCDPTPLVEELRETRPSLFKHTINHQKSVFDPLHQLTLPRGNERDSDSSENESPSKGSADVWRSSRKIEIRLSDEILMTQACYFDLMDDLTSHEPEQAGMLFGPSNQEGLITHYCPDLAGTGTPTTFKLDADFMNQKIRVFKDAEMSLQGIVHSHPPYVDRLSGGDLDYLRMLIGRPKNAELEFIFMPIVCGRRFIPYLVLPDLRVLSPKICLV